ncbi:twitching motility protein PilU [Methylohalomonas lacus]|uniref:Twitching motility protein PilU n=1 Tax=Methylohalomonas lacus TaxID=398773 RepID=A0AAE3HIZ9_9GAMM|nr:PilT/PilU family type 4a pilus ATPase [Methylohalomonas lacus]MCS3903259.1 twitching motility protein PilU [Methylohalomonas lacus]
MDITPYLKLMVDKKASDLFFTVGTQVKIKIEGKITSVGKTVLTSDLCKSVAYGLMNDKQIAYFEEHMECDFAIALPESDSRFRVNVFRQRGEIGVVMRLIPNKIPELDDFGLPEVLKDLILHKRGLILMVGATGSGKSTTLAAMLNHRNENLSGHILTIEDPVEFSHPNKKSIVNQREIGVDTFSYRNALRSSLREAPDVILIGEIRDRETMEASLELCNTGHLAISTMHANNASQAMERVVNLFPQELHKQLFMDLSLNLRAVISQRLVTGIDGMRVAAVEILINTPHIAELILKGAIDELRTAMESSGSQGVQTFDMALFNLYKEGRIELEEALGNADSRTNLEAKINFG